MYSVDYKQIVGKMKQWCDVYFKSIVQLKIKSEG